MPLTRSINSMQRTALRAAADAERYPHGHPKSQSLNRFLGIPTPRHFGDAGGGTLPRSLLASGRVALGGCPPRAPTDPYVLTLEHTVPQPTDSPSAKVPEAIRSSYGDM